MGCPMAFCPQCGTNVEDGGYLEGQLLECGKCGCSFAVDELGRKRRRKKKAEKMTFRGCLGCGCLAVLLAVLGLLALASLASIGEA